MQTSQSSQYLGVVALPIKSDALSIADGSLDVQFEVRHDTFYASTGRPRVEASGIDSLGAISLCLSLIAYVMWIWGFSYTYVPT